MWTALYHLPRSSKLGDQKKGRGEVPFLQGYNLTPLLFGGDPCYSAHQPNDKEEHYNGACWVSRLSAAKVMEAEGCIRTVCVHDFEQMLWKLKTERTCVPRHPQARRQLGEKLIQVGYMWETKCQKNIQAHLPSTHHWQMHGSQPPATSSEPHTNEPVRGTAFLTKTIVTTFLIASESSQTNDCR